MKSYIREAIIEQAQKTDNFYLYDERTIDNQIAQLQRHFSEVEFFYSVKANPAKRIVYKAIQKGFGVDAASLCEVKLAHDLGLTPDKIQYSAPGKQTEDLEGALGLATINADSLGEIQLIQEIAQTRNMIAEIGIRINPAFSFTSDAGVSSKFGVDQDQALEFLNICKDLPNIKVVGIHVHLRSQELQAKVLGDYYEKMFHLAEKIQDILGEKLQFVNMGSGLGIPYLGTEQPLDTRSLGQRMAELQQEFQNRLEGVRIILETGRFVVGQSGYYVTTVVDRKKSGDITYLILKNTLNGFLIPCVELLISQHAKENHSRGNEPLFTEKGPYEFIPLPKAVQVDTAQAVFEETERVTLVGNLCTATDVIAKDLELPVMKKGDVIAITNAGSYGAVLSPMQFSYQRPPAQLFLCRDSQICGADALR